MSEIHTTVTGEELKQIKEYGKGTINDGIRNLLKIAVSKEIVISIVTEIHMR